MKTKEQLAENSVTRYNHKDKWIQYEMRTCGRLSFIEGWDKCLEVLVSGKDNFDDNDVICDSNDNEWVAMYAVKPKINLLKLTITAKDRRINELEAEIQRLKKYEERIIPPGRA